MKILLIDTKHWYGSSYTYPRGAIPFALLCVATYLKERGKDVEIVDINASDIDYADLPQIIREKRPSIVGVPSSMTMYIPDSFRICKIAKSVDPDIITLGGGINFTAATEFYMKRCPELDFVVRGDGEPTSLELLEALENGEKDFHKIKGLAWREEGGILVNSERFVEDMDSLPFPNWDLLNLDKYHLGIFPSSWGKQAMFTLARGCPYNCNFCVAKRGQAKYRPPSVEWAIESISRLRYKYGRRMLYINDLCFGANDEWAENFFEKVVEKGIDINMCLDMRTDEVIRQKRLLPLMRKAGARIIAMGVESPLEKDEIFYAKKTGGNSPAGKSEEAFKLAKKAGIERWAFNMFGAPYHTPQDIQEIYRFANRLDGEVTIFAFTTPLPGTPFYDEVKDFIITDDLSYYSEAEPVTRNLYMTPEQLMVLFAEIWVAFYARPWRVIRGILSAEDTFRGWFYQRLYGRSKYFGKRVRSARERGHWPIPVEKEREYQKWAKKVLGVNPIERLMQDFMFKLFFKILRRGG